MHIKKTNDSPSQLTKQPGGVYLLSLLQWCSRTMACWLMGNDQIFGSSANTFSRMRGWMGCCRYGFVGEFKCRLLSLWKVPTDSFKQSSFSALKNSLSISSNNNISVLISPCVDPFKQPLSALKNSLHWSLQTASLTSQKLPTPIPSNNLSPLLKNLFFSIPSNILSPHSKTPCTDPFKQPLSVLKNYLHRSL